jgi:hypothetical protein
MTKTQITAILTANGNTITNTFSFYPNIRYIIVSKDKKVIVNTKEERRFFFDMANTTGILQIVICRPYSRYTSDAPSSDKMPPNAVSVNGSHILDASGQKIGDFFSGVVYEYLRDKLGNLVIDYYPFSSIEMIKVQEV